MQVLNEQEPPVSTISGLTPGGKTSPPKKRGVRLRELGDLRRFTARIANQLYFSEITEERARCLAYVVSVLSGIIKDGDLEKRLKILEAKNAEL